MYCKEATLETGTVGILICIGNHVDEGAIWEKIARQQENYTRRSRALFELL